MGPRRQALRRRDSTSRHTRNSNQPCSSFQLRMFCPTFFLFLFRPPSPSPVKPPYTKTLTNTRLPLKQLTNFFVAFITPVLLGASASGIYFLFGGCAILTVIVCSIYMPETRGFSLEAIDERFTTHRVGDLGFMKILKKLGSRIRRIIGRDASPASSSVNSLGSVGSFDNVTSMSENRVAVEEVELEVLSVRTAV